MFCTDGTPVQRPDELISASPSHALASAGRVWAPLEFKGGRLQGLQRLAGLGNCLSSAQRAVQRTFTAFNRLALLPLAKLGILFKQVP